MSKELNDLWPSIGNEMGAPNSRALTYVPLPGTNYVVPRLFDVAFQDPRLAYDVLLTISMRPDGPRCTHLDVLERPDGGEVTAVGLRSLPLALLMQQGARFMAREQTVDDDGTIRYTHARLSKKGRAAVESAWRLARAAPRRASFPATQVNLRLVGQLVEEVLKEADSAGRRPTVYASVQRALEQRGRAVSRATVQRRIKEAQDQGLAPRWVKETNR